MTTTVEEAKKALKTREKELTNVIELMASEERQIREAMELLKDYQSLRANGVATAAFDAPVAKYICAAADLNLNGTCYLNVGVRTF